MDRNYTVWNDPLSDLEEHTEDDTIVFTDGSKKLNRTASGWVIHLPNSTEPLKLLLLGIITRYIVLLLIIIIQVMI